MNRNDFEIQWQRRQQALQGAQKGAPADAAMNDMAQRAFEQVAESEPYEPMRPHPYRWVPYVAAAGLLIGISLLGLEWYGKTQLPVTQEVSIGGQAIRFLCNSGCSADDIVQSAQNIMIKSN